jgi:hypothetical protein
MRLELVNATKLFRLRLRDARKAIVAVLILTAVLVGMNLFMTVGSFSNSDTALNSHHLPDFSVLLLLLTPLVIAYTCWQDAVGKNSVFPQTSFSRFFSTMLLGIALIFFALCTVLGLYGLLYLLFSFSGLWHSNVVLGYSFGTSFLFSGFVAAFAFLAMITTAISVVSFLIRSYRLFAVVPILGLSLFGLLVSSDYVPTLRLLGLFYRIFEDFTNLLLHPQTFASFITACVVLSICMLFVVFLLRFFVKADRSSNSVSWMLAAVYVPWVAAMLIFGVSLYMDAGSYLSPHDATQVFPAQEQILEFRLPDNSALWIETTSDDEQVDYLLSSRMGTVSYGMLSLQIVLNDDEYTYETYRYKPGADELAKGESLDANDPQAQANMRDVRVVFTPQSFDFTSKALRELAQPELRLRLEANVLHVEHRSSGAGEVVFLPIWSMMGLIQENMYSQPMLEVMSK